MIENIKQSLGEEQIFCILLSGDVGCMPYKLFIAKLHLYGLSMSVCELMCSYHYNRKQQRVKLGKNISDWQCIYKGAGQRSIIGPQSYNIVSNDMLLPIDDELLIFNYADDNILVYTGYSYDSVKEKLLRNVNNVTS